jgi:hypothetical protein
MSHIAYGVGTVSIMADAMHQAMVARYMSAEVSNQAYAAALASLVALPMALMVWQCYMSSPGD